jgi:hypothetical protein
MKRFPVNSSVLRSIGYDPTSQTLEIEFPSNEVCQYFAVPPAVYNAFMTADSYGRYYAAHIRNTYRKNRVV